MIVNARQQVTWIFLICHVPGSSSLRLNVNEMGASADTTTVSAVAERELTTLMAPVFNGLILKL